MFARTALAILFVSSSIIPFKSGERRAESIYTSSLNAWSRERDGKSGSGEGDLYSSDSTDSYNANAPGRQRSSSSSAQRNDSQKTDANAPEKRRSSSSWLSAQRKDSQKPVAGVELFSKLDEAFKRDAEKSKLTNRIVKSKVNFVFLDKDGTQTAPSDFQDEVFKNEWKRRTDHCLAEHKKGEKSIHIVTATGQPFFMWKVTVGKAPYAVLSGGNAWVKDGEQVGQTTICREDMEKLMRVEDAVAKSMSKTMKFYYMNKNGMYSRSGENEIVDNQFFGYIATKDEQRKALKLNLNSDFGDILKRTEIEILYVKHCGVGRIDNRLINAFFEHLNKQFKTTFNKILSDKDSVNGHVWFIHGHKKQTLQAMVMMTGGHCEIAISVGNKATGMESLLHLVGSDAYVLMGAGDSGNDVPLRELVTREQRYFVAAPTAALLNKFSLPSKKDLGYDTEVFAESSRGVTVGGLWFQLLQFWNLCETPVAGIELFSKLDEAFKRDAEKSKLTNRIDESKVNFVFLDKDGTQTAPSDYGDEVFKKEWKTRTDHCLAEHKKGERDIHIVTATGQPFFMWNITVGEAPYAVLSGGNAWVKDGKQVGQLTIPREDVEKLMHVEDAVAEHMRNTTKFYYMDKDGMYSRSGENKIVDNQFFGYIATKDEQREALKLKLHSDLGDIIKRKKIEILYVKHCGVGRIDNRLINDFFKHLNKHFTTTFVQPLSDKDSVNGQVWLIHGHEAMLQAMVMMTGGHCEIAISLGNKATGMESLLHLVGSDANVLMGAGDSGNDVPLRDLVTREKGYFLAAPTAALLNEFSWPSKKELDYDKQVFAEVPKGKGVTVAGLWFQLLQFWNLC
eukprot:TRINITY_DN6328_c0_g1_i2.p1 TRINITY_DN6328_c0_g1~~TRINITY_DN6328_c0_g1_i2.p1  ORF type:complete len:846 (+),score=131.24 TRINITY_DN6328_c0_g1_i2:45-2582(+)